jgi:hypothetical protein
LSVKTLLVTGAVGFEPVVEPFGFELGFAGATGLLGCGLFEVVVLPLPEVLLPVVVVTGLPVILSNISFVPAPIAAPVNAFTTLLVVEFVFVLIGVTVGLTTDVGDVVLVVGVSEVLVVTTGLFVTVGLVTGVVFVGVVVLDVSVGFVVVLGFVVKDAGGFVGNVGLVAGKVGLVVGGVTVEVIGGRVAPPLTGIVPAGKPVRVPPPVDVIASSAKPPPAGRPVNEGRSLYSRITLSSGARSSPRASGIVLLDVRFFRIAMSYPVFFNIDVKPAMLVTGLNFALLASLGAGVDAF